MRSEGETPSACEETDVKVICALEEADGEYKDCPVACRANEDEPTEDTVVKSGDLAVSASANSSRRVIKGGVSDLDTLKFKTSEEVEITKVVLERYGYSSYESVNAVWLEDEDGNKITEEKEVNNKDLVTLSLKKDYRSVDGSLNAIVVVRMNDGEAVTYDETECRDAGGDWENAACSLDTEAFNVGSTIGFKVKDVTSTAKNLNLDSYSPYTYDIVDYTAGGLTVSANPTYKTYNYEEGKSYEVTRFKLRAGNAAVTLYGFTLENRGDLSADEFVDNVTVTVNNEKVKGLKYSFNKDDELVISFDAQEIGIRKTVTVAVEVELNDEFDEYGNVVAFVLNNPNDVNAVESKTAARVEVLGALKLDADIQYTAAKLEDETNPAELYAPAYKFGGSRVKLSSTKLGNVDAAQGSNGILIASGYVTLAEAIYKGNVSLTVNGDGAQYIESLTLVIDGDEYDGKLAGGKYTFSNVEVEKSGKVQLKIEIANEEGAKGSITFGALSFKGAGFVYEINKKSIDDEVSGSITVSKVTIQAARASLENKLTKEVEFLTGETARKVVFDGTYTAKKGDVNLNKFTVTGDPLPTNDTITFYLFIDGEEVADTDDLGEEESFSNVLVKAGKSVAVKVEAEVEAYGALVEAAQSYTIELKGTDDNDNEDSGKGSDATVGIKIKAKGTVTIPATSAAKTAIKRAQNTPIASFVVKPSNANEGILLEDIELQIKIDGKATTLTGDAFRVKVGGTEYDEDEAGSFKYIVNEELPAEGLTGEVILKKDMAGEIEVKVSKVNGKSFSNTYSKKLVDALVSFVKQDEGTTSTEYELDVDSADDAYSIKNFKVYACGSTPTVTREWTKPVEDNPDTDEDESAAGYCTVDGTKDTTVAEADCVTTEGNDGLLKTLTDVSDGETFTIMRGDKAVEICEVTYDIVNGTETVSSVSIDKATYKDYFKVNGKELAIPKA